MNENWSNWCAEMEAKSDDELYTAIKAMHSILRGVRSTTAQRMKLDRLWHICVRRERQDLFMAARDASKAEYQAIQQGQPR